MSEIIVKKPSVWMIHIDGTDTDLPIWINLALVERVTIAPDLTLVIFFSSERTLQLKGQQAIQFLDVLKTAPGYTA